MAGPRSYEGGLPDKAELEMVQQVHGVTLFGPLLDEEEAGRMAGQADGLRQHVNRSTFSSNSAMMPGGLTHQDHRVTLVRWPADEKDDASFAAQLQEQAKLPCRDVLRSGRALVALTGKEAGAWLSIFRTGPEDSRELHYDRADHPDPSFWRAFLALSGQRTVEFRTGRQIWRGRIAPGYGYLMRPQTQEHAAFYSKDTVALYVQGRD